MIRLLFGSDQKFLAVLTEEEGRALRAHLDSVLPKPRAAPPPDRMSPADAAKAVARSYGSGVR